MLGSVEIFFFLNGKRRNIHRRTMCLLSIVKGSVKSTLGAIASYFSAFKFLVSSFHDSTTYWTNSGESGNVRRHFGAGQTVESRQLNDNRHFAPFRNFGSWSGNWKPLNNWLSSDCRQKREEKKIAHFVELFALNEREGTRIRERMKEKEKVKRS